MKSPFTYDFVFSTEPRVRLARHGVFWALFWLFSMLIYGTRPMQWLHENRGMDLLEAALKGWIWAGVDAFFYLASHLVLTYGLIYGLMPRYVYQGKYGAFFAGLVLLMLSSAAVAAATTVFVVNPLHARWNLPTAGDAFFYSMIAGLRGATTIAGFAAAIKLTKRFFLQQRQLHGIQREKLSAELQLLKAQVHPHFLFNTLNNLYALTRRQAPEAPGVVLRLSNLLSYVLYECDAPEVPLNQEIQFLKNYVALEQLRYGDRLDVSLNFTGDIHGRNIAPLLLIPFLENAFKHGTSEQLDQAWISLNLAVEGRTLTFQLLNSRDPEGDETHLTGGIGLQNVRKRLDLLYPERHDLNLHAEADAFLVTLKLELSEQPERQQPAELVAQEV